MAYQKGHKKKGGRAKGTRNKVTVDLREAWFWVFEALGGKEGWLGFVQKCAVNQAQFYKTGEKMLPANVEVGGADGAPIRVRLEKVITTIDPNGSSGE